MDITIKTFGELTTDEIYDILRAREEVFFIEQGVDCEDIDGIDKVSVHMCYEDNGTIVGYLRMIPVGAVYEEAAIGRLLVRKPYRRQGVMRSMMEQAIRFMREEWGVGAIKISAQKYLVGFYEEIGFRVVSEEYPDGGLPHHEMLKKL